MVKCKCCPHPSFCSRDWLVPRFWTFLGERKWWSWRTVYSYDSWTIRRENCGRKSFDSFFGSKTFLVMRDGLFFILQTINTLIIAHLFINIFNWTVKTSITSTQVYTYVKWQWPLCQWMLCCCKMAGIHLRRVSIIWLSHIFFWSDLFGIFYWHRLLLFSYNRNMCSITNCELEWLIGIYTAFYCWAL